MRLIDAMRQAFAEATATGHRVAAWPLDHAAISQLRREADAENVDISSISSPITFLGVPIEEVPMSGTMHWAIVSAHRRYVPCRHDGRPIDRQWDIFDLDAIESLGVFYATKDDAERAAAGLQSGEPIGR